MTRTRLRRHPERASFDEKTIDSIFEEALVCHVAFIDDGPVVLPTIFARIDDHLYLHGSPLGRMMRIVGSGSPVAVSVSLIDGLVLDTSAFEHSMNYRSLVVFGNGRVVTDAVEKRRALDAIVDHLIPGRLEHLRPMTQREIDATMVVAIPLAESSVKIRQGPPGCSDEWPVWTGTIPLRQVADLPEGEEPLPDHVVEFVRSRSSRNTSTS
jgi:nitroimidazol reductase NimA-like FMN-containing flavoprotein (pyridoxamine 5'-phosphate oxidase superfamily)